MRPTLLLRLALALVAGPLAAQQIVPVPSVAVRRALLPSWEAVAPDTVPMRIRPTYWVAGGVAGGILLGLGMAALIGGLCSSDSADRNCTGRTLGGFVLGASTGFGIGALIGGMFPKKAASAGE